ncbi:ArsR/SmtB family transcription factor [Paramicrobacterium agarici]|uniref:ArsR family transcriptional regulator n=1 Tax=Paramicrobacterium agarici TaxID=630514 RepID=A0A2A9DT28_9MICO|nr:metalloregulator ArsR/SmtB family transcription factor [Microbacterium agarici]PFG29848.1 ArsR family transcriptional regulator [Microbacterium agarici]TQO22857.1 ArsR family transcriptional regulator [Microbacterium agarici]
MVVQKTSDDEADRIFHALADATRRDIVTRVMEQALSVSVLAAGYAMSFAAVQKHVAVLERAELVTKQRRGREQLVFGNPDAVKRAAALLDEYEAIWRGRVARMHDIINDDSGEPS